VGGEASAGHGAGALRFDLDARGLLLRDVTGAQPALRRRRELGGAALDRLDLGDALLRGEQIVEGPGSGDLLLQRDLLHIEFGGAGGALRGARAQHPLVAALVGPVQPDALVDALVAQQIARAEAVLEIHRTALGRQLRRGRMVGGHHIGVGRGERAPRQRNIAVLAGRLQGHWQRHGDCRRHGLSPRGCGAAQGGDQ
jgi:hypothetical protein